MQETWVPSLDWEGNGNPLQYSYLGNPKDKEDWQATVHGVAKESNSVTKQQPQKSMQCRKSSYLKLRKERNRY